MHIPLAALPENTCEMRVQSFGPGRTFVRRWSARFKLVGSHANQIIDNTCALGFTHVV
jgi:hypothetical protein